MKAVALLALVASLSLAIPSAHAALGDGTTKTPDPATIPGRLGARLLFRAYGAYLARHPVQTWTSTFFGGVFVFGLSPQSAPPHVVPVAPPPF